VLDLILELGDLLDNLLAFLLLLGVVIAFGDGTEDIVNGSGTG
jgi:hypothetical protein